MRSVSKKITIFTIVLSLSLPVIGCGDSDNGNGGSSNFPVPDIEGQKQKALDAADKAEQKQKEIEDNLKDIEVAP